MTAPTFRQTRIIPAHRDRRAGFFDSARATQITCPRTSPSGQGSRQVLRPDARTAGLQRLTQLLVGL